MFNRSQSTTSIAPRHQSSCRLLVTGCGRSGTKYTSILLQRLGIDTPHERLGRDGICSWTMAVRTESRPYGPPSSAVSFREVFHQVREPLAVIRSALSFREESWDYISHHIDCPRFEPPMLRAARYWLLWNEQAERIATWRYRIEDLHDLLPAFCKRIVVQPRSNVLTSLPTDINTRQAGRALHIAEEFFRRIGTTFPTRLRAALWIPQRRSPLSWDMLTELDPNLSARVQAKAIEYGYEPAIELQNLPPCSAREDFQGCAVEDDFAWDPGGAHQRRRHI